MIAVFISGSGSNLQALIDSPFGGSIAVVVSNKADAYGVQRAEQAGIPVRVISHRKKKRIDFETEIIESLSDFDVKWILLAGFMRILSPHFLSAFPQRVVNIHPSLLPSFPGLHAQKQAWDAGVQLSGATIHLVDEGVDSGEILIQGAVPRLASDDFSSFSSRILEIEHTIYPRVLSWICTDALADTQRPKSGRYIFWSANSTN